MRYSLLTFGCRVNQAESLAIDAKLRSAGGEEADCREADLVIVNSCSVTATADQGTRQAIRRIARENPRARIVVTGCYATRRPGEVSALPGVVHLVPNARKDSLLAEVSALEWGGTSSMPAVSPPGAGGPALRACGACRASVSRTKAPSGGDARSWVTGTQLRQHREGPRGVFVRHAEPAPSAGPPVPGDSQVQDLQTPILPEARRAEALRHFALGRTAFTLRVQTGCEESCSYCIIPTTRGASRSTPPGDLLAELRRIEQSGYREVTLTGVHLGAYGRDLQPQTSLVSLVETVLAGTERLVLRLGSLEPMDCPRALVDVAASTARLAPAFHLPLQHASDRMLAAMRRPYTRRAYAAIVDDLRARLPHASITADVIVGFPGECDEDADELVAYLEASPLTQLHVFPYSDRPGTEASAMGEKVHGAVVRDRAARVRRVGQQLAERFRRAQAGTVRRALTIDDGSMAMTDNGLRITLPERRPRNEHVRVRMVHDGALLTGEVLDER